MEFEIYLENNNMLGELFSSGKNELLVPEKSKLISLNKYKQNQLKKTTNLFRKHKQINQVLFNSSLHFKNSRKRSTVLLH